MEILKINDKSVCVSRFQMICVDRNFGRDRGKSDDHQSSETNHLNTNEDLNLTKSVTTQNTSNIFPMEFVQSYPRNQSYFLTNYPFYPPPPPYSLFAAPWTTAASNLFLPPTLISTRTNFNETGDVEKILLNLNGENPNSTTNHLQNTQFLYGAHPLNSPYISPTSTYATIPSYRPVRPTPTIIPRNQSPQILLNLNNSIQQSSTIKKPLIERNVNDLISPLTLTQRAVAMSLLNTGPNQTTEIANEILKELTTPTAENNTTDIDNKISAAMDLVKMHLLSAVRDEVTELRQKIEILKEKLNNTEHENAFLRQHISNDIYAQYICLSSSND